MFFKLLLISLIYVYCGCDVIKLYSNYDGQQIESRQILKRKNFNWSQHSFKSRKTYLILLQFPCTGEFSLVQVVSL
jgi:hypothetical protein